MLLKFSQGTEILFTHKVFIWFDHRGFKTLDRAVNAFFDEAGPSNDLLLEFIDQLPKTEFGFLRKHSNKSLYLYLTDSAAIQFKLTMSDVFIQSMERLPTSTATLVSDR